MHQKQQIPKYKFLKYLDFYLNSHLHIGVSIATLTLITELFTGVKGQKIALLNFLLAPVAYNIIRGIKIKNGGHRSQTWYFKHQIHLKYLNATLATLALPLLWSLNLKAIWLFLTLTLLTLWYGYPIKRWGNLRSIPRLKIFIIGGIWTCLSVVMPLMISEKIISEAHLIYIFLQWLFLIALTLPFDMRDTDKDPQKLKTLPQMIGHQRSKILIMVLLIVVLFGYYWTGIDSRKIITSAMVFFGYGMMVIRLKKTTSRYLTSLWIEGIPIFWYIVLLASQFIIFLDICRG